MRLVAAANASLPSTAPPTTADWITNFTDIVSKFSLRPAAVPEDDVCYLVAGSPETISECGFNPETQTFVVIHGWTVRLLFKNPRLDRFPDGWFPESPESPASHQNTHISEQSS